MLTQLHGELKEQISERFDSEDIPSETGYNVNIKDFGQWLCDLHLKVIWDFICDNDPTTFNEDDVPVLPIESLENVLYNLILMYEQNHSEHFEPPLSEARPFIDRMSKIVKGRMDEMHFVSFATFSEIGSWLYEAEVSMGLYELFREIDKDGDGILSVSELQTYLEENELKLSEDEFEKWFSSSPEWDFGAFSTFMVPSLESFPNEAVQYVFLKAITNADKHRHIRRPTIQYDDPLSGFSYSPALSPFPFTPSVRSHAQFSFLDGSRHGSMAALDPAPITRPTTMDTVAFFNDMQRIMLFMEYKFDVKIYKTTTDVNIGSFETLGFTLDENANDARVKEVLDHDFINEGVGPGTRIENIDGKPISTYKEAMSVLESSRYPILVNFSLSKNVVLTDVHPSLISKGLENGKIVVAINNSFLDGLSEAVIQDILRRARNQTMLALTLSKMDSIIPEDDVFSVDVKHANQRKNWDELPKDVSIYFERPKERNVYYGFALWGGETHQKKQVMRGAMVTNCRMKVREEGLEVGYMVVGRNFRNLLGPMAFDDIVQELKEVEKGITINFRKGIKHIVKFSSRPFGFEFSPCNNNINAVVTGVRPDGPALMKGVREGDLILEINGHDLRGCEFGQYLCLIRSLPLPVSITFVHARPQPLGVEEIMRSDNRARQEKIVTFSKRPFGIVLWTDESSHNAIVIGKYQRENSCSEPDFDLISAGDMICSINGESVVNMTYFKIRGILENCELPAQIEFKPVMQTERDIDIIFDRIMADTNEDEEAGTPRLNEADEEVMSKVALEKTLEKRALAISSTLRSSVILQDIGDTQLITRQQFHDAVRRSRGNEVTKIIENVDANDVVTITFHTRPFGFHVGPDNDKNNAVVVSVDAEARARGVIEGSRIVEIEGRHVVGELYTILNSKLVGGELPMEISFQVMKTDLFTFTTRPFNLSIEGLWGGTNAAIIDVENRNDARISRARAGHIITAVNDLDVRDWKISDIVSLLKSEKLLEPSRELSVSKRDVEESGSEFEETVKANPLPLDMKVVRCRPAMNDFTKANLKLLKEFYLQFRRDSSVDKHLPIAQHFRPFGYSIYRKMLASVHRKNRNRFTQLLASDEDYMSFENFAAAICNGDLEIWLADVQAFLLRQKEHSARDYIPKIKDEYELETEIHNFLRSYPEGILESELTLEFDKYVFFADYDYRGDDLIDFLQNKKPNIAKMARSSNPQFGEMRVYMYNPNHKTRRHGIHCNHELLKFSPDESGKNFIVQQTRGDLAKLLKPGDMITEVMSKDMHLIDLQGRKFEEIEKIIQNEVPDNFSVNIWPRFRKFLMIESRPGESLPFCLGHDNRVFSLEKARNILDAGIRIGDRLVAIESSTRSRSVVDWPLLDILRTLEEEERNRSHPMKLVFEPDVNRKCKRFVFRRADFGLSLTSDIYDNNVIVKNAKRKEYTEIYGLCSGMILTRINDEIAYGRPFEEIMNSMNNTAMPLSLEFLPGNTFWVKFNNGKEIEFDIVKAADEGSGSLKKSGGANVVDVSERCAELGIRKGQKLMHIDQQAVRFGQDGKFKRIANLLDKAKKQATKDGAIWIEFQETTADWISFDTNNLPFDVQCDAFTGKNAIVTKLYDPTLIEKGFFPWSQLLSVNGTSLVDKNFEAIQQTIFKAKPPILFEFERNPRGDYLDILKREAKANLRYGVDDKEKRPRFSFGHFLMKNLPFKKDVMKDIYNYIGSDPQMSYILLTQEEARTKLKVSYADYKSRKGAQLVATKGLPALKAARVEIGDRIISINGEDVSTLETSQIVRMLHSTHMNGKVWIEFCPAKKEVIKLLGNLNASVVPPTYFTMEGKRVVPKQLEENLIVIRVSGMAAEKGVGVGDLVYSVDGRDYVDKKMTKELAQYLGDMKAAKKEYSITFVKNQIDVDDRDRILFELPTVGDCEEVFKQLATSYYSEHKGEEKEGKEKELVKAAFIEALMKEAELEKVTLPAAKDLFGLSTGINQYLTAADFYSEMRRVDDIRLDKFVKRLADKHWVNKKSKSHAGSMHQGSTPKTPGFSKDSHWDNEIIDVDTEYETDDGSKKIVKVETGPFGDTKGKVEDDSEDSEDSEAGRRRGSTMALKPKMWSNIDDGVDSDEDNMFTMDTDKERFSPHPSAAGFTVKRGPEAADDNGILKRGPENDREDDSESIADNDA